jgi:hypothetical protein
MFECIPPSTVVFDCKQPIISNTAFVLWASNPFPRNAWTAFLRTIGKIWSIQKDGEELMMRTEVI